MKTLNPYKIQWAVTIDKNNIATFKFGSNKSSLLKRINPKQGSKVYIITDKQFGMSVNSFNGTEPTVNSPLSNQLIVKQSNGVLTAIPMTDKQFNNPIQY